ncbi:MAG: nitrile hydratase subunit alpha [Nitriliruptorales bacterium]|nr:nitrile hydratase subunit alpha [Nitriliruptorales bacterium]
MNQDQTATPAGAHGPATRARIIEEELRESGVLHDDDIVQRTGSVPTAEKFIEGRRVVARAWVDAAFRQRLLADASSAIAELGLTVEAGHQPGLELRAVENTDLVHNLIVCTLCSCYPRALLGAPPSWYASEAYRAKAVRDPAGVLEDFGLQLADEVTIQVWDSTAETRYLVVPQRPDGTENWSEEALSELITADALIGTVLVTAPAIA